MPADVAVIGAGLVGLAVARKVARSGGRVVVIDRDEPGSRASWAAAGMLAPQSEAEEPGPFISLLMNARDFYPSLVQDLEAETGIGVGYRQSGMIVLAFDEEEAAALDSLARWQESAALPVERLSVADLGKLEPSLSPSITSAIRFAGDHQVDNRLLTRAYRASAEAAGATLRIGVAVRGIESTPGSAIVRLEDGSSAEAATVVLAAGSWSGLIEGLPTSLPVEPVHGQLISLDAGEPAIRHLVAGAGGYMVPRAGGRLIIGATTERFGFRTAITTDGLRRLTTAALRMAPGLADCRVVAQWSGLRPGTPDGLPILGADPDMPRLLYATGHYRNGILLAPLTGEIIGTLALGGTSEQDIEAYGVGRFRSGRPVSSPAYPLDTT